MHTTQTATTVKSSSDSDRCPVCRQAGWRCSCRWAIGPGERLIKKATGRIRVLANRYKYTSVRVTTGKTVRDMFLIFGNYPGRWVVTSTEADAKPGFIPADQHYAVDLEAEECDCPDSVRRRNAGLPVGHSLRPCKHIAVLNALLKRQDEVLAAG